MNKLKGKFKPYIRRMKKSDLKHMKYGGMAAVYMGMYWERYQKGKSGVPYVMVQRKNRGNIVMACGKYKRDVNSGNIMLLLKKCTFNEWANIMKRGIQREYIRDKQ